MTREPTEMELRVAGAYCCPRGCRGGAVQFNDKCDMWWDEHFEKTRAAIRAMREPTEDMEMAPYRANVQAGDYTMAAHEAASAWRAMIDAASPDV